MTKSKCPHCGETNEIPEHYLGKEMKCPSCRAIYVTTQQSESTKPPEPEALKTERTKIRDSITEPRKSSVNPTPWLLSVFILIFIYTNRSLLVPGKNQGEDLRRRPALDVRQNTQVWEYRIERYGNADANDERDNVIIRSYDDAEKATSVFIPESSLKSLGDGGWELVSTYLEMETAFYNFGKSDLHTGIRENVRPQSVVAIFKRPKD